MTPSSPTPANSLRLSPDLDSSPPQRAAIIGVGLLGGSIGLALRQRWPRLRVFGTSRTEATRQLALRTGCVTHASGDEHEACHDADLVFICTPVGQIAEKVIQLAGACPEHALLTDVGSTKRKIVERIEQHEPAADKFVGSHPIAGGEKTGPANGRADLFQNKCVVVTPTARTDADRLQRTAALWKSWGAHVLELSPSIHDEHLAGISHATHFASCAIASILRADEIALVGSGWRDTTRVAAGDPQMWADIALQNAAPIVERMQAINHQLQHLIDAIDRGDRDRLMQLLTVAQQLRQCVPPIDTESEPGSEFDPDR